MGEKWIFHSLFVWPCVLHCVFSWQDHSCFKISGFGQKKLNFVDNFQSIFGIHVDDEGFFSDEDQPVFWYKTLSAIYVLAFVHAIAAKN